MLGTLPNHSQATDGLPDLLTVEEAAQLLRIGRTKAYAMAREWRATGGQSGLPVIDLGNVLRVPRHLLEEMLGGKLTALPVKGGAATTNGDVVPAPRSRDDQAEAPTNGRTAIRRSRRPSQIDCDQPNLFEPGPISDRS